MFRPLALACSALALAFGATLSGCAHQPETRAPSGPALWELSDEDTTIYLFGTVHFLPEGLDWFTPQIEAALTGADQFVTEIDTSAIPQVAPGETPPPEALAIAQMQMRLAQLTTGGTLRELMTEEDRAQYEGAMADAGIPPEAFDGFEPWFAFVTLSQLALVQQGLDPSAGVERSLDALVEGKDRAAFETVEQQFTMLDSLPLQSQLTMLDGTVESLPEMGNALRAMIDEWIAGDAEGLAQMMNEELTDPAVYEALLTDRNANWAEWIDARMDEPGTVFIAVGAGHLAGEGSVQDQLAERGYIVERAEP